MRVLAFVFIVIFAAPAYAGCAVPTDGLVAHWALDSSSGTTAADSSGSGHTATLYGSPLPTWQPSSGKLGGALRFASTDDYAETAASADFSITSFTLATWVRFSTSGGSWKALIEHHRAGSNWYILGRDNVDRGYFKYSNGVSNPANYILTAQTLSADTWYHLAGTFDAATTTAVIYINGVSRANTSAATAGIAALDKVRLGRTLHSGDEFDGDMDDVRIYNRALSADEVFALYLNGMEGVIQYNSDYKTMQFCDGSVWRDMKNLPGCPEGDTIVMSSFGWRCSSG